MLQLADAFPPSRREVYATVEVLSSIASLSVAGGGVARVITAYTKNRCTPQGQTGIETLVVYTQSGDLPLSDAHEPQYIIEVKDSANGEGILEWVQQLTHEAHQIMSGNTVATPV
jgi:hypothetical protein